MIIDRIPFPRPDDPLMSARQRAADQAGGNGFMQVAATHAALLLAQGTGRLIRTTTDRGVVAVLDPRLATARYGGFLKASLPPMWTTTDPALVRKALARLAAEAVADRCSGPGQERGGRHVAGPVARPGPPSRARVPSAGRGIHPHATARWSARRVDQPHRHDHQAQPTATSRIQWLPVPTTTTAVMSGVHPGQAAQPRRLRVCGWTTSATHSAQPACRLREGGQLVGQPAHARGRGGVGAPPAVARRAGCSTSM